MARSPHVDDQRSCRPTDLATLTVVRGWGDSGAWSCNVLQADGCSSS
ncbi:MAG: hypothetical protein H8E93_02620 [Synechococcus sp.]|nr:hypothetical protein [Synechococcus sp.]